MGGSPYTIACDISELELIGSIHATFPDNNSPADFNQALASFPSQLAQSHSIICVKPNQFIDNGDEMRSFCERVVQSFAAFGS